MGLRNRIFKRGAAQPADVTATDADQAAEAPAGADEAGASAPPADDITVIRAPAGDPGQPTLITPAAEHPEPAPAEPAPQGDPLVGHPEPAPAPQDPHPAPPEHAPQGDPVEPSPEVLPEGEAPAAELVPEGALVPDPAAAALVPRRPGFRERGRLRRRLRYLREVRELGFRDLGGLVFDQARFGRPNEQLVAGKVAAIDAVDRELRAIEDALGRRAPYDELFIPGVSACPRCGALHGSDARFCPNCGLAFSGPRAVASVAVEPGAPAAPVDAAPPAGGPAPPAGAQPA
jgi:hypothetical protein